VELQIDHLELAVSWLSDVGNPAALVGGAALANFFEVYECMRAPRSTRQLAWKVLLHNGHLTFYKNYVHMAQGLVSLTIQRYYTGQWPPRPLPMLALIPFGASIYMMATGLVMVWKKHHVRSQSAVV
jgi:hypothetical protein